jgi:hypothetical protein
MSSRTRILPRFTRSIMTLGLVALAATACRTAVRPMVDPATSSLVVRNTSLFDINVYALPTDDGAPVWLATVPASGSRALAVNKRQLQRDGGLVIRTQALGSTRSWTSGKISVDDAWVAVLDLVTDWVGDSSASQFYAVARELPVVGPDK